jgi:hypothetical protein
MLSDSSPSPSDATRRTRADLTVSAGARARRRTITFVSRFGIRIPLTHSIVKSGSPSEAAPFPHRDTWLNHLEFGRMYVSVVLHTLLSLRAMIMASEINSHAGDEHLDICRASNWIDEIMPDVGSPFTPSTAMLTCMIAREKIAMRPLLTS